jgi:hypothetical protein
MLPNALPAVRRSKARAEDPGRRRIMKIDLVRLHLTQSALAGQYEIDGDLVAADQLRAFCWLRVCTQGDHFLFRIARATAPSDSAAWEVFYQLLERRKELIACRDEWVGDVYGGHKEASIEEGYRNIG